MKTNRKAIYLIGAVLFVLLAYVFVRADEQTGCHVSNISRGAFWTRDFSSQISVSSNENSKTIDFTRLTQFENICIVELYTYGIPYQPKWMRENVRSDGPKACWTDIDHHFTIAGIFKDGTPNWTRIRFEGAYRYYAIRGEECISTKHAILRCAGNVCQFPPSNEPGDTKW